jgi:UDP-4-amino-4,6-dideoxy-N-acetyl-beta-L-altrosamine transaminase
MIPYGRQTIEQDDVDAVAEALQSGYLTTGPAVDAFESALAQATGAADAVACANGTAALHLAAMALDLAPGDVVIVPAQTFLATANAVRFTGAQVVFSDVDAETGLMGPDHLRAALDHAQRVGRPRALFAVHLNGQPAPMHALVPIAREAGLAIVEDSCHAIGGRLPAMFDGREPPVGSCAWGDMATFSFHPVKTITMAEGGAVTVRDAQMARRLRRLRGHGMERDPEAFQRADAAFDAAGQPNPWYYEMTELGHNFRASDVQCALGRAQLAKLHRFVARRAELVVRYDALLHSFGPLLRPIARVAAGTPAWHLYPVLIDFAAAGVSRSRLMRRLRDHGIGTQVHYIPVCDHPYWRGQVGDSEVPGARSYYARVLSLPLFPAMADQDVDRVVAALGQSLAGWLKPAGPGHDMKE